MNITYVKGDATRPIGDGNKIIAHIVNSLGGWGSGFVVPLGALYPKAEMSYRRWADHRNQEVSEWSPEFELGNTQFVNVAPGLCVANMCAQDGYPSRANPHPCDLDATASCLEDVYRLAFNNDASIHMPRIGCGLGGAEWDEILTCIEKATQYLPADRIPPTTVYDL